MLRGSETIPGIADSDASLEQVWGLPGFGETKGMDVGIDLHRGPVVGFAP